MFVLFVIGIGTMFVWGFIDKQSNESIALKNDKTSTTSSISTKPTTSSASTTPSNSSISTKPTTSSASTKPSNPSTPPPPPPTPPPINCGSAGGSCTTAQVATHNNANNCWVIYNGSYYDVTAYVNNHSGGPGAFTPTTCGHDITRYMSGSTNAGTTVRAHSHSGRAYGTLNSYRVGAVSG